MCNLNSEYLDLGRRFNPYALRHLLSSAAFCNKIPRSILFVNSNFNFFTSVLELNDLVKACEEEFGVSAAAGVVVAAAGAGEAAEEKDEFDVELTEVGPNKVKVIKVVREITGLGLKEAKEVVDGAPKMVKEGASKAEAEDIKTKLEAEGAKVTLK